MQASRQEGAGAGQGRGHMWEAGAGWQDGGTTPTPGVRRAENGLHPDSGAGRVVRPAEEGRGTGQWDRAAGNPAKRLMSELLKSAVEGLKSQHRREGRQSPKGLRTGLRGLCERGGGHSRLQADRRAGGQD